MASGYIRQSAGQIVTGNTIQASDFNNEYNQLQSFADGTIGHDHSGGTGLGPQLSLATAVTGILTPANGGTGVANNAASTITITGAHPLGFTIAGNTSLTLPSSGTVATTSNNLSVFASTTSAQLASIISDETGSGVVVFGTSPTITSATLVTPALGVASATSINKVAITAPASSATLTIADGKTLTASNTLTFTGTDASSVAFGTGGTVVYSGVTTLSSLVSVGTITTGTWSATTIAVNKGGTGLTTLTANNVILGAGTSTPTFVAPSTSGNVLTSNGTTWVSSAASGGVTSFTGDATILSNSASTGAVTATLVSQVKNTFLAGPTTGSNAAPTFRILDKSDLPIATSTNIGGVIPDGTIVTVSGAGAITVAKGSSSLFGVVKVDNTTITASAGIISAAPVLMTALAVGSIILAGSTAGVAITAGTSYAAAAITPQFFNVNGTSNSGDVISGTWLALGSTTNASTACFTLFQRIA